MKKHVSENLRYASLVAHQLKSPLAAISTIMRTLIGEYAGPLSTKQKDLLKKANLRCDEGIESIRRMLAIVSFMEGEKGVEGSADLAKVVRQGQLNFADKASKQNISILVDLDIEPAYVVSEEAALIEAVNAVIGNALKYTPDNGRVKIALSPGKKKDTITLRVGDSGVGIPKKDQDKIFIPFFRTPGARKSARPGTGLGLAFVKAVIEAAGGKVDVGKSQLGGAEIEINLPVSKVGEESAMSEKKKEKAFRVVIVGGVAAGPKVAAKVIRMMPDAEVTIVEKHKFLSYAGCGLPFYIAGDVKSQRELMSSPAGAVRDSVFFQSVKNISVMNQTEAIEINRKDKRVRIKDIINGNESWLEYDKLVLATGASPVVPKIPGVDLKNIFTLHGMEDAEGIKAAIGKGRARDVTIVGGGLIGAEMTEALVRKGCRVTIVEMLNRILPVILDTEIAKLLENYLESKGVKVMTDTKVISFEGDERVKTVKTTGQAFPTDMVILGIGVSPNVSLAKAADLEIGSTGAIKVDKCMRTSDPDIYAAGDCVESVDLVTGRPYYLPMGSVANKQGRVAAVNICGGKDSFDGVLGSTICKIFDYSVGRTGLTENKARQLGYDVTTVLVPAPDKAHYMPDSKKLLLKLVVQKNTGRLLGAQATGPGNADKRIDIAAMAITAGMTIHQVANSDLCYAPPFSEAMDNIITAANVARNKLAGYMVGVAPMEVHKMQEEKAEFIFLDVRSPGEYEQVRLPGSINIPLGALRGRLNELPKDKEIVTFCQISLRGYEASLILNSAGFKKVRVMDGGIDMWPYEKVS